MVLEVTPVSVSPGVLIRIRHSVFIRFVFNFTSYFYVHHAACELDAHVWGLFHSRMQQDLSYLSLIYCTE
jgi:hypothetical protein